jgi:hypothetical protein
MRSDLPGDAVVSDRILVVESVTTPVSSELKLVGDAYCKCLVAIKKRNQCNNLIKLSNDFEKLMRMKIRNVLLCSWHPNLKSQKRLIQVHSS